MTPPLPIEIYLLCFGAGSVIHGVQTILAAKLMRHPSGHHGASVISGISIGPIPFFWQFGNFAGGALASLGFPAESGWFAGAQFVREAALVCFPLLFARVCLDLPHSPSDRNYLRAIGAYFRYPLWLWTILGIGVTSASALGKQLPGLNGNFVSLVTLYIMLFYFVIYTVTVAKLRRSAESTGVPSLGRARKAAVIAGALAVGTFVLMLSGYMGVPIPFFAYIELAAMMTSVPFAIAVAYRLYEFPFMDVFIREVIAGVILLAAFAVAVSVSRAFLWITICAVVLAYCKAPITRWVERKFLGYEEPVEQQEERIGTAIRALTQMEEFSACVSEILAGELGAEWVEIGATPRADAVHRFELAGSGLWISIGLRVGGRQYMSRQLRFARMAALQLAAHHHQLRQHELRGDSARAQMRALKAQINPHFLFNTLNVLASLIHSNPPKAERVTEELADIFRYALESTREEWVKLDDELRFIESYLEIEKARFEERLMYSFDVAVAIRALKVPPMILQPLVENAIKHGIGPNVQGGEIRVSAQTVADHLVIVVEDTGAGGDGVRQRGAGIGLGNIRERLKHVYGEAASLELQQLKDQRTRAVLRLPQLAGVHS
jgi:signal transduction histidine kinase